MALKVAMVPGYIVYLRVLIYCPGVYRTYGLRTV